MNPHGGKMLHPVLMSTVRHAPGLEPSRSLRRSQRLSVLPCSAQECPLNSGSAETGWYRLSDKDLVPGGLLLDGPNPYLGDLVNDYGPNGYATLEFNGEHLVEFVHNATGEIIWEQRLA